MYYVYGLINPIDNKLFYIGYGQGNRAEQHFIRFLNKRGEKYDKNPLKNSIFKNINDNKLKPIIKIFSENITHKKAIKIEIKLIKKFGRIHNNTGCLCNLTPGGDGRSGISHSDKTRNKISESLKTSDKFKEYNLTRINTHLSESTKEKIRKKLKGKHRTREVIDKIKLQKGWNHSNSSKIKMKEGKEKNMPEIKVTNLQTNETIKIKRIKEFCQNNGLNKSTFRKSLKNNLIYKNYKIEYLE